MQILTYDFKTILSPLCATADIEQCNTVGWTALHHACFHGHNDVIQGNLLRSIDNKIVTIEFTVRELAALIFCHPYFHQYFYQNS